MNERILVVDDKESLCERLQLNLEIEGYRVDVAYSAEQALAMPLPDYDLLLMDVMMGAMSGFKMAQLLMRDELTAHIPILFCTTKDTEIDTVAGLNLGNDDYISKPFSIREVAARVKCLLRRTATQATRRAEANVVSFETLMVDLSSKSCIVDGRTVRLTKKEFEILAFLLRHQGRIFSREEILNRVWSDEVIVAYRTIDVNITRLRKKIGRYGDNLKTRFGYGYGFEA